MTQTNQIKHDLSGQRGTLFLVPAPLDFGCSTQAPITFALPARTLEVASGLEYWICENAKTLRAYLKRVGEVYPLKLAIQQVQIQELPHAVHKKGDHLGETLLSDDRCGDHVRYRIDLPQRDANG